MNAYDWQNMGLIMLLNTGDRVFSAVKALFLAVDSRFKFKKWGDGGPQSSGTLFYNRSCTQILMLTALQRL